MNRLENKVAIVTGGARGIGRSVCEVFANEGANVITIDLSDITYANKRIEGYKADLSNKEELVIIAEYVKNKYGKVDILVNNAGITKDALIEKMTEDMWDDVINVNLKSVFNLTQLIVPIMKENKSGSIINISSIVGEYGNVGQSNYAATKAGIIGLTKTWAKEFSRNGENIRVNAVAPGYTNTEMMATVPGKILDSIRKKTMLKRLGEPKEIANVILFLGSDEASYITGQLLSVNGGLRL